MKRKKKKYYGYTIEIPKNIEIVEIDKEIEIDPYGGKGIEKRYVIVNLDSGEIFDDANGYGYKSYQKAMSAYKFKSQGKENIEIRYKKEEEIESWCARNKGKVRAIGEMKFVALKDRIPFTVDDLANYLISEGVDINSLPFTVGELYKRV